MRLGIRLLFAFFVVAGLAGFFALQVFRNEVGPSVREVIEDLLVDTANLVAALASEDLQAMPPGGDLRGTRLDQAIASYRTRAVDARIWGLEKQTLDLRIYVTDSRGRVVLASGGATGSIDVGADLSQWNDVGRTLAGKYGARTTRDIATDERSAVMYVAAPVRVASGVIGVVAVAKPIASVQPIVDRAQRKIFGTGLILLGIASATGVAVTWWLVTAVRRLKQYALHVQAGRRPPVPVLPGELGDLATAVDDMRARLEERERLEHTVRALTHELKSPLAAIQGAAELLQDDLPAQDRLRFASQVTDQSNRLKNLVDRMLSLSRLEAMRSLDQPMRIDLLELLDEVVSHHSALATQRDLTAEWEYRETVHVQGDPTSLEMLVSNLWTNALDFAPDRSVLTCKVSRSGSSAVIVLRDRGPGVTGFALELLGQRFLSMPRPRDRTRGTGLGLAIVLRVAALHGGYVAFENADPGLRVTVHLPLA